MQPVEYHVTIKELPPQMRPRERLMQEGAGILSDSELLAILLRTGTRSTTAVDLASYILAKFGGLRALVDASVEELSAVKGVGPAKAVQVKAALELAKRLATASAEKRPLVKSPEDVAGLAMEKLRHLDREHFMALLLNTRHEVLYQETVAIGTLNSSTVHPRELFKSAIKRSAAALILLHNHPSGDPTPSKEDIEVTRRLEKAGRLIGIEVLDHVIIGDNRYTSFKAEGLI